VGGLASGSISVGRTDQPGRNVGSTCAISKNELLTRMDAAFLGWLEKTLLATCIQSLPVPTMFTISPHYLITCAAKMKVPAGALVILEE